MQAEDRREARYFYGAVVTFSLAALMGAVQALANEPFGVRVLLGIVVSLIPVTLLFLVRPFLRERPTATGRPSTREPARNETARR